MEPAARAALYKPLDAAKVEIRLLRILHSADNGKTLHCDMITVSLDEILPDYNALSYEWGPPDLSEENSVVVNSHKAITTINLWLALNHLPKDRYYWIDFISINQGDLDERAKQVRLMTRIYQTASRVEVWLGPEDSFVGKGLELLDDYERLTYPDDEPLRDLSTLWVPSKKGHWDGLCRLLENSYWTRMWIVQEIVVAKSTWQTLLRCGFKTGRFDNIYSILMAVEKAYFGSMVRSDPNEMIPGAGSWASLYTKLFVPASIPAWIYIHSTVWNQELLRKDLNLPFLIHCYGQQKCSDPRDRVYALLGFSFNHGDFELEIDYSSPIEEVYKKTARYIILDSKRLDILLYVQSNTDASTELPTWIPDWRVYNGDQRIINTEKSDWNSSLSMPASFRFSPSGTSLFAKGLLLGTISSLEAKPEWSTKFDNAGARGRYPLFLWRLGKSRLNFAIDCLETEHNSVTPEESTVNALYEIHVLSYQLQVRAAERLPSSRYLKFSNELHQCTIEKEQPLPEMPPNLPNRLWQQRQMFCITLEKMRAHRSIKSLFKDKSGKPVTQKAIGLGSPDAKVGDIVAIIGGCKHPVILRETSCGFRVLGETCVAGYMDGQAVGKFDEREFELI